MKLKKIILVSMLVLGSIQWCFAIPADPTPKKIHQIDGSYITVVLRGDEHSHLSFTEDGYPLYYNPQTHLYEYASLQGNKIASSGIKAADKMARNAKAKTYLRQMNVGAIMTTFVNQSRMLKAQRISAYKHLKINDFPSLGKQKTLVILLEFSDKSFTSVSNPHQFYTDMLNKRGFTYSNGAMGSARDFYLTSSDGKFDPQFVVVGPVKLPKASTYYGSDDPTTDAKMGEAVVEACKMVDDSVDFSQYDADGDGYVDNIAFIYAGNGQADTNVSSYIWPHAANIETEWHKTLECDGKKIGHYFCSNELRYNLEGKNIPTGIGTVVHEFGHILGLPDLYDVSYSMFNFGVYYWDTMAAGSYNNNMNTPPTFSSYERMVLGWLTPENLTGKTDSICVLPNLADCNRAYRISVPGKPSEYYMLENRQIKGWDQYVYGHGMLVWHIDEDSTCWANNAINTNMAHQHVDIVEADGIQSEATRTGDTYPGTADVTNCKFVSWKGDSLLNLDYILENDDTVKFIVAKTDYKIAAPDMTISAIRDSSFLLTWTNVPEAQYYNVSIYKKNSEGNKIFLRDFNNKRFASVQTLQIDSLQPDTDYYVEVVSGFGSYHSTAYTKLLKTLVVPFIYRKPMALNATDITDKSFTANWTAVKDAESYDISLYKHSFGAKNIIKGYDFSERTSGMPAMWSSTSSTFYSVSGYYGESAPSIRLGNEGDYLEIAFPESKINKLSFWYRSKDGSGKIYVEKFLNNKWVQVSEIKSLSTAGKVISVETDNSDKVRIRYEHETGFIVLDDVEAICNIVERTAVKGYENINIGNAVKYVFKDLEAGETYDFRVKAQNEKEMSLTSDEYIVDLSDVTNNISHILSGNGPAVYYDLSGKMILSSKLSPGVYIVKQGNKIYKRVIK